METSENISHKYSLLIHSYLKGQLTTGEKQALLIWLEESDDNRMFFTEQQKQFELTSTAKVEGVFSRSESKTWKKLESHITQTNENTNTRSIGTYLKLAASVIVVFSLGSLSTLWFSKSSSLADLSKIQHEIIVPKGGQSKLVLPDGTVVWLNAGTHFSYNGDYGIKNRNVYLVGEGFFSVIKDPKKPFIVQASGLQVKAYGTKFNVKAYPEEKIVTTTLVDGVVKIEGKGINISMKPKDVVILQKGIKEVAKPVSEKANVAVKEPFAPNENRPIERKTKASEVRVESNANTELHTSWKDNRWIIASQSLEDMGIMLERKFNVSISINSPGLNKYKFTGTFTKETLEQILDVMKLSAPLKYEIKNGKVIIEEEQKRMATYNNL